MNEMEKINESLCDENELTIAGEWMEQLAAISNRRATVQSLLAKAEENAADVKESIFERVQQDYHARLAQIEQELSPVAAHIRQALAQIETLERSIRVRLEWIEDLIEEQNFRCKVGEYPEHELDEKVDALAALKVRLDSHLEIAHTTYGCCAKFLGDDWRNEDVEAAHTNDMLSLQLEQTTEQDIVDPINIQSELDSVGLAWADLGTQVAPVSENAPASDRDTARIELELTKPAEVMACEPVSETQAQVRAELEACLQMINLKGEPEIFEFGEEGISIGKSTVNDVVVKKAGVSRRHARVELRSPGEYHVQDLSGRGIEVNGLFTEQAVLHGGDTITVGKVDFELITRD